MAKKPAPSAADGLPSGDAALFRSAVGEVQPLPEQKRITPQAVRRKPLPRAAAPIPASLPDGCPAASSQESAAGNAPDEYLGNGLSRMTLRKLRRGFWPVQDSLDLHGNNSDSARKLLQGFLQQAIRRELRCVRVIHGKGLNSRDGEAVLRRLARHWLMQHPRVLGYCDAPPGGGGSGAALVLLKMER